MKKLFMICALVLFSVTVYADGNQTCKVKGTTGSVVVSTFDTEGGAIVTFSNDTDEYVNVTAQITFGASKPRTVSKMVPPHSESSLSVDGAGQSDVRSVSGTKCD